LKLFLKLKILVVHRINQKSPKAQFNLIEEFPQQPILKYFKRS